MIKNKTLRIVFTLLVLFVFFPSNAFAYGVTSVDYNSSDDTYYIYFDPTNVSTFTFKNEETGSIGTYNYAGQNYMPFRCNATATIKFYDSAGTLLGTDTFTTTQIQSENTACAPSTDSGGTSGSDSQNITVHVECPGWDEHMVKMDEILAAIPPAPNWNNVATIFRDTIAPQIKADLQQVLGSAPSSPDIPTPPTAPIQPSGLDDGGITAPTGQEAPGLSESTFSETDIKTAAPVIQERQDPTGGFTISDPVGSLPTQEEFKQNAPVEGTVEFPVVVEGSAPLPTAPIEQENIAPTPVEETAIVPTAPVEEENIAPTPVEGENVAPSPTGDTSTAPLPGTSTETAPLPGADTSTAPIPGDTTDTAPLPGESTTETTTTTSP